MVPTTLWRCASAQQSHTTTIAGLSPLMVLVSLLFRAAQLKARMSIPNLTGIMAAASDVRYETPEIIGTASYYDDRALHASRGGVHPSPQSARCKTAG